MAKVELMLQGCNKEQDDFSYEPDNSTEIEMALKKLKTEKEINFFDFNYLASANPYLLPAISGRDPLAPHLPALSSCGEMWRKKVANNYAL